jgi:hypothetical protein
MTQITPKLIEQTIKKCNEHMKARGLNKKTRDSYESMIRRFMFWEKENWKRIEALCLKAAWRRFSQIWPMTNYIHLAMERADISDASPLDLL